MESNGGVSSQDTTKGNNNGDGPIPILRPDIADDGIIKKMIKDNYGLTAVSMKPLNGYDDLNYHLKAEPQHCNSHIQEVSSLGYFVKIVNAQDSKHPEFQFSQKKAMEYLNGCGIPCQTPVKGVNGDDFTELTVEDKGEKTIYLVCVRTFLPGMLVVDANWSPELFYELGQFVAKLSKVFENFSDPFYKDFVPAWSMENMSQVAAATHAVKTDLHRKTSEEIIQAFNDDVMPRRDQFRKGQIHGDLNEQNILLEACHGDGGSGYKISGLIDFQDCAYTYPIYDLTISMAYMMMLPDLDISVIDVGGHMLAGYTSLLKINEAEKKVMRTLIAARMTMSLVYGAYTNLLDPTNEYTLTTAKAGWKALVEFWNTSKETVDKRWEEIVQSYNKSN